LKEEALDRTLWRTRFGGGYGPSVRPHSHCKPSRAEFNRTERVTIHIASRADPNWKQCSWHFWTDRMSNQVHVFSLMDNIWRRSLLFT